MRYGVGVVAALVGMLLVLALKGWSMVPPPLPAEARPGTFDAVRAKTRLSDLLNGEGAHPVDSDGGDRVRGRLVDALRRIGLEPRVADDRICRGARGTVACARVRNVVATIGPAAGPALLLVAHYDSATAGPGASDDGIGVATMLEVAALVRDRPGRPVVLLFNEGEEAGLLGARAFLDADPEAGRIARAINMEARGVTGRAWMFETSRPDGPAIAAYRAAAVRPAANSLSSDVYARLPNATDVDVFRERGWTMHNFAITGNETRYHTPADTPAALDPRSVQHMGDTVLALTRDWIDGRDAGATGAHVYADLAGRHLMAMPMAVAIGWLGLLAGGFAVALWRAGRGGRAIGLPVAATVGGGLAAMAAAAGIGLVRPGDYWRGVPQATAFAMDAAALLAAALALAFVGRGLSDRQARVGAWTGVMILGLVVAVLAPGGAIYFLVAPGVALLALPAGRWRPGLEAGLGCAAAAAQLAMFVPLFAAVEETLVAGPPWLTAPLVALVSLPVFVEARALAGGWAARPALAAGGAALAAGIAAVLVAPQGTAQRPARLGIDHVADRTAGTTRWMIADNGARLPAALAALGDWRREPVPWLSDVTRRATGAPPAPVAGPVLEPVGRIAVGDGRRVRLRLRTGGAQSVTLRFARAAGLVAAGIGGPLRRAGGDGPHVNLRCQGRACDGALVDLLFAGRTPRPAMLVAVHPGLPPSAAPLVRARPADAVPQYAPDSRIVVGRVRI